jgi:hypothetical protein
MMEGGWRSSLTSHSTPRIDPPSAPPSEAPCQAAAPNRPEAEGLSFDLVLRHMSWNFCGSGAASGRIRPARHEKEQFRVTQVATRVLLYGDTPVAALQRTRNPVCSTVSRRGDSLIGLKISRRIGRDHSDNAAYRPLQDCHNCLITIFAAASRQFSRHLSLRPVASHWVRCTQRPLNNAVGFLWQTAQNPASSPSPVA